MRPAPSMVCVNLTFLGENTKTILIASVCQKDCCVGFAEKGSAYAEHLVYPIIRICACAIMYVNNVYASKMDPFLGHTYACYAVSLTGT